MEKNIVSTFLQLAPLTECNASAIVDVLKKTLDEHGLDLHNLIGIGTDNASVMVGINNGVYQKLKEEIPSLVLVTLSRKMCVSLFTISSVTCKFSHFAQQLGVSC